MFSKIKEFADTNKYEYIIDSTNFDDINTFRPGLRANEELKIISSFKEFKITKNEIRKYLENIDLILSKKPSSPCLATRFPYNTKLSNENLKIVEAGELILKKAGFNEVEYYGEFEEYHDKSQRIIFVCHKRREGM